MEIVRTKDTGTLQDDTYLNDDQSECIVLERFGNSDALIEHAEHLATSRRRSLRRSPWFTASSSANERRAPSEAGRQRGPGSLHALPVDVDTARRLGPFAGLLW